MDMGRFLVPSNPAIGTMRGDIQTGLGRFGDRQGTVRTEETRERQGRQGDRQEGAG